MNRRSFLSLLAGLPIVGKYWKRKQAVDQFTTIPLFCGPDRLPKRNGATIRWWRYSLDPADAAVPIGSARNARLSVDKIIREELHTKPIETDLLIV